uniref:Uncharacterized protein n=1 Tax=Arundo donax TaxID=35708 RepID=A0A0A9G980_ARUDO
MNHGFCIFISLESVILHSDMNIYSTQTIGNLGWMDGASIGWDKRIIVTCVYL